MWFGARMQPSKARGDEFLEVVSRREGAKAAERPTPEEAGSSVCGASVADRKRAQEDFNQRQVKHRQAVGMGDVVDRGMEMSADAIHPRPRWADMEDDDTLDTFRRWIRLCDLQIKGRL